jgi:hypothetical protein
MRDRPVIAIPRVGMSAGLFAGMVLGLAEILLAVFRHPSATGAFVGGPAVLAFDVTLGALVGVLQAGTLAAAARWESLERAFRVARAATGSVVRPADPMVEAGRVASATAALLTALAGAVGVYWIALRAVPEVRIARITAPVYALAAAAVALLALAATPGLARRLTPLARRIGPAANVRNLTLIVAAVTGLVAMAVHERIAAFTRAVDISPLILAVVFVAANAVALVVLVAPGRGRAHRLMMISTHRLGIAVAVAVFVACWLLTLGPGSRMPDALRVYRGGAPIAGKLVRVAARVTDSDGDGYSAWFGDGDCAPSDPKRSPGAREIPGNGIDDDCFDGDMSADTSSYDPPAPDSLPASAPSDLSFVVIVADTLRADHMTVYGYDRPTTPNLAAFAERAVVFERAYSPSAYTYASVPAMFTGQFPTMLPRSIMRKHGKIRASDETMATLLKTAGYRTALVSDAGGVLGQMGLGKGFDKTSITHDKANRVTDGSIAQLDSFGDDGFFLTSYYIGPHSPYVAHDGVPSFGDGFEARYDHEVANVDRQIGRLLDRLAQPDLRDRVVIVVMADHGEAFGEHGTYYHGHNLHDENVHVPLLIAGPGIVPARIGEAPVSLIDVFPTVLQLARVPIPEVARGYSLTRELFGGAPRLDRHVFMESHFVGYGVDLGYQAAVVTRDAKLIEDTDSRTFALYDLPSDPHERSDISARDPERVLELRRVLKAFQSFGK